MLKYLAKKYFLRQGLLDAKSAESLLERLKSAQPLDDGSTLQPNQVAVIKLLQNSIDEKLGDFASEYDSLTEEQLSSMVRKQTETNTEFFSLLVKEGYINGSDLNAELEKLRQYYGLNALGISRNLKEDFDQILSEIISSKDFYANEYARIALKYILRFIGTSIKFGDSAHVENYYAERIILQKLVTSTDRYFIAIASEKASLQSFNDGIDNVFAPDSAESRYGSLFSFINCITNIFHCMVSKEKEVLFADSTNVYKHSTITVNESCYLVPMYIDDMRLDLLVGYGTKPYFSTISHNI